MLYLSLAVLLVASGATASPVATETPAYSHNSIASALNEFSVSLLLRLSQEKEQENVFASPLSVSTALSVVLLGAKGTTADEITRGLHFDHLTTNSEQTVHQQLQQLLDSQTGNNSSVSLANYLLLRRQDGVNAVISHFKSQASDLYHAQVQDVDFADGDKVVADVNAWVNDKTKGLIRSMLSSPPDADCRAMLLNAIHFKGEWEQKFSAYGSSNKSFFNRGSDETTTVFMQKLGKYFPYGEDRIAGQKVQVLELPYDRDSLSMLILLPDTRTGLKDILSSADFEKDVSVALSAFRNGKKRTEMNLHIPKFRIEADVPLNQPLTKMGIGKMFTPAADLSGMTGETNLFIKSAKHKAVVNVDEDGTEAAAVTLFDVYPMSAHFPYVPPKDFIADHPFLFMIQDQETGLIFFVGKVEQL